LSYIPYLVDTTLVSSISKPPVGELDDFFLREIPHKKQFIFAVEILWYLKRKTFLFNVQPSQIRIIYY